MFELFANPANMVLGGALVSAPVIIHLINRMRFRRLRWAAMEFLLKSQKRNRRRLIIEQLILLALRILLVLLAALLLARFLGAGMFRPRNTLHVVILDDRLSMGDQWKSEEGGRRTALDVARGLIEKDIARKALQARSAQRLVLRRLSEPSEELFDRRLNEDTLKELADVLARLDAPSYQHLDLADGIRTARDLFSQRDVSPDEHVLYLVSDFRQRHWGGAEAQKLHDALAGLKGVAVHLLDCAHPFRTAGQRDPLYHDNLAVADLRPETRVVAEGMPVQFSVRVANFSPAERKQVRVTVKVDGAERPEGSLTLASVPPAGSAEQTFQVAFVRPQGLAAGQPCYAVITANLENEEAGLPADNTRYAVVEVRRRVPVLLVDGDPTGGEKPGGDTYHLRAVCSAAHGFEAARGGMNELERPTLDRFAAIYLLNVAELTEKARRNLEEYVRQGGSVVFFMGERVRPEFYNKYLYAGGRGLFPAYLADRPTPELTEEQKQQKVIQNLTEPRDQLHIRDKHHPIFAELATEQMRPAFRYISIDRHWPVLRQKWDPKQREAHHVEELASLPNERPVSDYEPEARALAESVPVNDPRYAAYRPLLERHRVAVLEALSARELYVLGNALEDLLSGQSDPPPTPGTTPAAGMREFWKLSDPRIVQLHQQADSLRERVQMGDPLMIVGRYGQGRTAAFLTTAGQKWNDWAGGTGALTFPIMILELQKYLTSLEGEAGRTVGSRVEFRLDATRYLPLLRTSLQQEAAGNAPVPPGGGAARPPGPRSLGEQAGSESGGEVLLSFDAARQPGVYLFDLFDAASRAESGARTPAQTRAYAFNVDTENESDLKRAGSTELARLTGVAAVDHPNGRPIVEPNRQADLSESPWLFLLFLGILLAEQALAVHLSFHLRGAEAALPPAASRRRATAA